MHFKLWYLIFIIFFTNTNFIVKINAEGKNNGFIQRKLGLYISDRPKNILVGSVIGGGSHLNPMLEICKILEDRGYKVTLAAPGNFTAKSTLYHSIPQIITGERRDTYKLPGYNKAFFNKYTFKNLVDSRKDTNERYIKTFNNYLQAYKETYADLLFCDYSANDACFDLAWKLKKPVVGFASTTVYFTPPHPFISDPMMNCNVNMEHESFYNRFICALVQPLRISWYFRKNLEYLNSKRAEVGVNKHDDFRGRITNTLFLIDTFFGFEISSAWNPIHQEIGPILPDTYPGLSPDLELFLSTHPRTMYIALGTYVYTTTNNYVILLQSALELINHNILDGVIWATVKFNESELPSTFTLSTGDVIPTSNLLDNLYPHIHITKFAPQFAILSHENTKVFLSHGGIGSSHESMYTATPMLVLPIAFDQPGNAERLELSGMALKLSKLDLKIDDIESKVIKLMNEKRFKMNAKRMQTLAKFNSKRKYRGADLIEIVMNLAEQEGVRNENNELEVDNDVLLRHWITPDSRMGLIRGKYLDVFGAAVIIGITLIGGFGYGSYKIIRFAFKRWFSKGKDARENSSKHKNE
ncbi:Glycosyltransferase Family 1 protein [Gigaspora rosea]|uniref:Glycosyltransferase Family 1 protein n=1 Tax=Gigaspora rosea TaxID=44941 RepID=A0A397VIJ7_9GLOM|nr:Glycosyltransferase Family 1 protein [Gigaspora rosea]